MSPEQVRAVAVDHRTDLFSFGAILYEMLVGRRAFVGETPVQTMHAILTQEPPPLAGEDGFSPGLVRLVERCLEKSPGERFQAANDLAFALETLSNHSGHAAGLDAGWAPSAWRLWTAVALLVLGAAVPLAFLAGRDAERQAPASFRRLSFRRGTILHARFAPDGQTVVYAGAWGGEAPRELLERVQQADWHPDGRRLAAVRERGGRRRLEFPVGTVLHETDGWIGAVRFSPRGDRIAFAHHPELDDDGGSVMVADLEGGARSVWGPRSSITGLAWRPGADELWISSADGAHTSRLDALTLAGRRRLIARFADRLSLHDIARDGRVLLTRDLLAAGMRVQRAGAARQGDISWLDASLAADVSRDGRALLFGEGASQTRAVYLQLDGGAPVRLGEGRAAALSPDRRWALAIPRDAPARLLLLPTGTGSARTLRHHGISAYHLAGLMPDGARVVFREATPRARRASTWAPPKTATPGPWRWRA
jgi:hypothetical protein